MALHVLQFSTFFCLFLNNNFKLYYDQIKGFVIVKFTFSL